MLQEGEVQSGVCTMARKGKRVGEKKFKVPAPAPDNLGRKFAYWTEEKVNTFALLISNACRGIVVMWSLSRFCALGSGSGVC